jgi:BirA family biotin operon repressor/biotin-[acetyl-CoA-carboxylase] ligase
MAVPLCDRVLKSLLETKGIPLSGTSIAERFGVSRAAIWKSVENLRAKGYDIQSLPARGYLLNAGLGEPTAAELEVGLATKWMGRVHRHFDEIGSTNREAVKWATDGAAEGALVTASRQSSGRGRLGRKWLDRPGESLLMSLVLRPSLELTRINGITYVAAIALAEALSYWVDEELIEIKWPNDVLLGGRKVAGILLESHLEGAAAKFVIVGLGLNVGGDIKGFDEEIRQLATTVEANVGADAGGHAPTVLEALAKFLERLEELYETFLESGLEGVNRRWNHWFRMVGRRVTVKVGDRTLSGEVVGLDSDGALELRTEGGSNEKILAGDVMLSTTKG